MGLKRKQALMRQKAAIERELQERLSTLSGKGIKSPQKDKDPLVRKLKADIRAVNRRLGVIAGHDKRTEESARIKAERAAAPRKEQEGGKGEKPKKAPEEGKGKRVKADKKAAPSIAQEGGKSQKVTGSSEEGKDKAT